MRDELTSWNEKHVYKVREQRIPLVADELAAKRIATEIPEV
ncbi:hypothetical protein [Prosthecochloris sp. CIB 2401]|nr:hypothetical protein [Prosthecochloris sp. CIB 2401]ANT65977.1 hypothetical protein Ptc2401_02252 [Prosthecochloris sp. CIB 2401]